MWVSIDFCLLPLGVDISISSYVSACISIIEKYGLEHELGPNGTAIEGDWEDVFECIKSCHEKIHELGASRIHTTLKINTRTDRKQSFREKIQSVISKNDSE